MEDNQLLPIIAKIEVFKIADFIMNRDRTITISNTFDKVVLTKEEVLALSKELAQLADMMDKMMLRNSNNSNIGTY